MAGDRSGVELTDDTPPGTWRNRGEHVVYDSHWVRLVIADVLMPDGTQVDHHVVRAPRHAAGTIVVDGDRVLLLYRHRFITDTWGWEIPAGAVDDGESLQDAAIREAVEESGWEPRSVERLCSFHPANGLLDQTFHIFVSGDAVHRGEPTDRNEATRIEWFTIGELVDMIRAGEVTDGLSLGGLTYALAVDRI